MKQMFDISEKLISEQSDEIYGVTKNKLGRFFMEVFFFGWWWRSHQSLARKGVRILRLCVMPWKDEREPTIKYCLGGQVDVVQKFIKMQSFGHNWWWANGIRVEYFTSFTTLQPCYKVQEFMSKMSVQPEDFTGRIIFMSMFNDISSGSKDNEKECESNVQLFSLYAKRFGAGQWSFLGPGSEKWYSTLECKPQGERTELQSWWFLHSAKANTQSSDPQVHRLEECSRAKVVENYQYTSALLRERLKLFFAQLFQLISSVFTEQSQICVTNANLPCKNKETCFGGTIWPIVCPEKFVDENTYTFHRWSCARRSIVKDTKIEWTSYHNKIVWLNFVHIEEFSQFTDSVACREYTFPRDENHRSRKVGFEWARIGSHKQLPTR